VTLKDGRVVVARPAGKLRRPGRYQSLRLGFAVSVQYSLEEDEDMQVPQIISRELPSDSSGDYKQ